MSDYKRMYVVLLYAIDGVLDELEKIPVAYPYARRLQEALWEAENIAIDTMPYFEESENSKIIYMKFDKMPGE